MGVDKGYGSGYKNTGKADPTVGKNGKRRASGAELSRAKDLKSGALGRPEGASPFNNIKGKAIKWDELTGLAASAGLAAAGIAASRTGAGRRVIKSVKPVAPRIDAAATRLSKASRAALTAHQLQTEYHLRKVDDAVSDWYSAKARPNSTRGEMNNPVFREMNSRASANSARKAAEAIQESGRLDASLTGTRILGRLQNYQNIKKRRGGR